MNRKALVNRVIVLEEFCIDLLGMLPPGYVPFDESKPFVAEQQLGDAPIQPPTAEQYIGDCTTGG